ncbi:ATP-dependent DNA helicase [Draconibacterium halophilum]|uniref:AAA family ATPase n=1 Tax=Draconibacterium halophilum TaxID=2706887 RepID=A0A6C0RBH0_9BACT|nr:AAA family ATPase [Draconibacterium halophilum]QIA07794.1 AAA family ATPase [Draconibacterium halophilum]
MIKNHLKAVLTEKLGFPPTNSQAHLIDTLASFISGVEPDRIMLIKGYAGTGKTTMIYSLTQCLLSLKIRSVLLAPTGRAAKVMASYSGMPAFTIHKKIYRQQSTSDGMGRFVLNKNLYKNTYFIVDEASMISNEMSENAVFGSGRLLDDLLEYVYSGENCHLVLVGDTAQLPPVGLTISPALEAFSLEQYGFSVSEVELKDVVRQAEGSGILNNATEMRNIIAEHHHEGFFPIETQNFPDVERISGGELIETISSCYDKYGFFDTTVVTRSNKRANLFNKGIRGSILYKENEIERGDLVMVVKNNYFWPDEDTKLDFIANGDIAEIISIYGYEELYGFRFADVCLRFVDYEDVELDCKIFLETLSIETASFPSERNRELFKAVSEDYPDIRNKKERWEKIKENPHFNALQVKYAYALTCHKAQGGQWKAVFVDHGYLVEDMLDTEYYRWLYTAFTRPAEKLYLVNFDKGFFDGEEGF